MSVTTQPLEPALLELTLNLSAVVKNELQDYKIKWCSCILKLQQAIGICCLICDMAVPSL